MNIVTEEIEDCKLNIKYTADSDVVEEKIQQAINELKNLKIPGFRKGKASTAVIKLKFKDRIEQWVKTEMLNSAHEDILFETKIRPISNPQIKSSKLTGNNFSCELLYMKKPDFTLQQYEGLNIPDPHMEKDVNEMIESFLQDLRMKHGDVQAYEDTDRVKDGDKVTLSYLSSVGNEEGKVHTVGSGPLFSPEFDENLVGMALDEQRLFTINVDGNPVDFTVTIHMGLKTTPCALDDNLAQACQLKDLAELRNAVENVAKEQYNVSRDDKISKQIVNQLVASHDFNPPSWLVDMEYQQLAAQENINLETVTDQVKEDVRSRALNNVKFALILDSIRLDKPEAEVSDEEAINGIKSMVSQRGVPNVDEWVASAAKTGTLYGLVARFKNDYTMKYIIDKAIIQ